jgi:outer membrane receptor protein involved in Fe transport
MRRVLRFALLVAGCTSYLLLGQVDTGAFSGHVYDASGAVIPGCAVSVKNVGTNYSLDLTTNSDGFYVSPPLPTGTYQIAAKQVGFAPEAKQVELRIADRLAIDFKLQPGSVAENIEVQALADILQTETATLSTVRSDQEIQNLPNRGRLFSEAIRYSPGDVPGQEQSNGGPIINVRGDTANAFNGASWLDNNFLVDGIQDNDSHQGYGVLIFPEIEAIEQYRVETSVPDARFGRSGSTVNVAYKSGTNKFHGVLYEFLRNDKLEAKNFFTVGNKPPYRRNQFGVTLGGPIGGSGAKTFFFLSFDGQRVAQDENDTSSVPTVATRGGDFGQLLSQGKPVQIYDPLTGSGQVRSPFPNNVIPASLFNPAGYNVLNFYPEPTGPGLGNNFYFVSPRPASTNQGTAKVDRDFSGGSRGFFRFTQGSGDFTNATVLGPVATPALVVHAPSEQAVGSYTRILSPTFIMQARLAATRENAGSTFNNGGRDTSQQLGIPNVNVSALTAGLTLMSVSGYTNLGEPQNQPAIIAMNSYQFSTNFDLIRSGHSFKFGFDVVRRQTNVFQEVNPRGLATFSTIYTNNPALPSGTGSSVADLLLGKPDTFEVDVLDGTRALRRTDIDWYIQDDWKVTRTLTLNLGLRYELPYGYPNYEARGRQMQFDPLTGEVAPIASDGFPGPGGVHTDYKDFAPRAGLAYQVSRNTVVRAAYGIFYVMIPIQIAESLAANPPYMYSTTVTNDQANFIGARALSDGPMRTADINAPGQNYVGFDPNMRTAYSQEWNIAVQRQLPFQQQISVAYVGNKGTDLYQAFNANQAVPGAGAVNTRRRWPNDALVTWRNSERNAIYHSMQVLLSKRVSRGLQYQFAYTWSHAIDTWQDGTSVGTNILVPITNLTLNRGNATNDMRHQARLTLLYEFPFGKGKAHLGNMSPVLDKVLGQWQLSSNLTLHSGTVADVVAGSNTLNIGESCRGNRLRNGNLPPGERTIQEWFDTGAFVNPGPGLWGNSGRNVIIGPGTKQLDFTLFKDFRMSESKVLQFRAEAYNLTNTPQFNNPNTTIGSPAFGQISSAGAPNTGQREQRQVQLALRFQF